MIVVEKKESIEVKLLEAMEKFIMELKSEAALRINEHVNSLSKEQVEKWPLEIDGYKRKLPYYTFPRKLLRFNVSNGRLAMECQDWALQNGRSLDSNLADDAKIICDLLLDLDKDKTEELKIDLQKVGQMEPGVITHDGVVINGNRRMAVMEHLHKNVDPSGKWLNFDAILLPPDINPSQLWKIEAGLQLSQNKVASYHPVNELLKIRQGVEAGLETKEIAAAIYGLYESEITTSLERLKIIDQFLIFFDKSKPKNYGLIKSFGLHEYFINIQKSILQPARQKGVGKAEEAKRIMYAFALIRAHVKSQNSKDVKGISHFDIRQLGKIYELPRAYVAYVGSLPQSKDVRDIPPDVVLDSYRSGKEVLDLEAEKNKPKKLVERAIKALQSIDRDSSYFKKSDLQPDIDSLLDLAKEIKKALEKQ